MEIISKLGENPTKMYVFFTLQQVCHQKQQPYYYAELYSMMI